LIKVRWVDTSEIMAGMLEAKKLKGESSKLKANENLKLNCKTQVFRVSAAFHMSPVYTISFTDLQNAKWCRIEPTPTLINS